MKTFYLELYNSFLKVLQTSAKAKKKIVFILTRIFINVPILYAWKHQKTYVFKGCKVGTWEVMD